MNKNSPHQDNSDQSKSIEDLEIIAWPSPTLTSYVAQTCFDLRRKPLRDMTDEDLRLSLEQQIGVDYLAPLAIERLKVDPLIEARIYPGDLLQSLLELPPSYWQRNPRIRDEVATLASARFALARECSSPWQDEILPALCETYARFTGTLPARAWIRPNEGKAPPNG
jgi:CDI immunity proteins